MNADIIIRLLTIGLSNGAIIALNAIGVTLVYSIVRLINFAHGDLFALTTVVTAWLVSAFSLEAGMPPLALFGALVMVFVGTISVGALLNVGIERAAFRPFRNGPRIAPLIATIGISFMLYQAALLARYVTNAYVPGDHRSVPGIPELPRLRIPELLPDWDIIAALGLPLRVRLPVSDLLPIVAALALAAVVGLFLRSRIGVALLACAQDPEMAQLCGINRNRAISATFALGGALAGAAAFVFALYYTHPYTLYGAQSGLLAFTAAVLGGVGRPRGALLAGLLLGVVAAFSDYYLAVQWTPVLLLMLLIGLLVLRPGGLSRDENDISQAASPVALAARERNGSRRSRWILAGLLLGGALYPVLDAVLGGGTQLVVLGALIFVLLALGLNLVLGFAGLLDLGYAASFAIGAYTAGWLTMPGGSFAFLGTSQNFLVVFAICAAAAGLFGALNATLTLRLRGEYLAIVTLAFGQLVPLLMINLDSITSGARGLTGIPAPQLLGFTFGTPTQRYYLALGMIALTALTSLWLGRSRIGRAWAALSVDEVAAASSGVPPANMRILAFTLGGAVAGLAGALFASSFSYVDPGASDFRITAMVLAMVVVGGAGSVSGAIIGALLIAAIDQFAISWVGAWAAARAAEGYWFLGMFDVRTLNFLFFGLALYLTTLLRARRA